MHVLILSIQCLHRMEGFYGHREAVPFLKYMTPECPRELNCILHDTDIALPEYIKDIE